MKTLMIGAALAVAFTATPALAQGKSGKDKGHKAMNHAGMNHAGMNHGDQARSGYGRYGAWGNSCPPGLAKKNNGCLPPGQARKRYNVGQRWSNNYGQSWTYNQIPYDWRQQYGLDANDRYYYRDGYLYQVDPRTRLVEQVLSAILR